MRKSLFSIIFLVSLLSLYAKEFESVIDFTVNKTDFAIGRKIEFQFTIQSDSDKAEYNLLMKEFAVSSPIEVLNVKLEQLPNYKTRVSGIFSIYTSGKFDALYFQVPVNYVGDSVKIYRTKEFSLNVFDVLTDEEKQVIEKNKENANIELKADLPQEKFRFYFEGWLLFVVIVLVLATLLTLLISYIIKKVKPKKGGDSKNIDPMSHLSPYEKFIYIVELSTTKSEERAELERSLSEISGALKELIEKTFSLNATSETTRELIASLRNQNADEVLVSNIKAVFNSMDMVKFAKAEINQKLFAEFLQTTKELGYTVNQIYLSTHVQSENVNSKGDSK